MTDPRTTVREWLTHTGWIIPQFLRGVRQAISSDGPGDQRFRRWLDGEAEVSRHSANGMLLFVGRFPEPGSFADWSDSIALAARDRANDAIAAIADRRDAVQRERAERAAALLAAERAPRTIAQPWFPSQRFLSTSHQGTRAG